MKFNSYCVKESKDTKTTKPHALPIYASSSFCFENIDQGINIFSGKEEGHVYSRYANPTIDAVANKIAQMETFGTDQEAHCVMTSSGMSAISTLIAGVLKSGDTILSQGNLYGGTTELIQNTFDHLGIKSKFIDLKNLDLVEDTLKSDRSIKMIYCETPANPTLAVIDLKAIAELCKKYGIKSAIDNTFCTPYLQRPFSFGIDYIIHSTTKYLHGHGNSTAGAIVGTDIEAMKQKVWTAMKLLGTNCNPFDAWLTNNGMKTLTLRMDKHCNNAQQIAEYLESNPKIERVNYNGLPSHADHELAKRQMSQFGAMISFEVKGGLEAGISLMNKVRFCTLAPTLGDVDTLILHPASMSHLRVPKEMRERNGITDGLIRLSVGIEEAEDIIADLEQAL